MQRISLLIAILLSSLALAGCLGGQDEVDSNDASPPADEGTEATTNQTDPQDDAPPVNTPPTAGLTADVTSGQAPLVVTFRLTGSDADGDALTWTLDATTDGTPDADGDALPQDVEYNFTIAGNHTATLTVTDGTNSTATNLTITVTEAAPPAPAPLPDNITFSDTITGAYIGVGYQAVEERAHNWSFESASVTNMTVSVTFDDATTIDLDWALFAPDGTEVVSRANYNVPGGADVPGVASFGAEEAPYSVTDRALLKQTGQWLLEIYPGESVEGGYTVLVTFA